jgi:predicted lipid-binding transport protein (Tim44 family)
MAANKDFNVIYFIAGAEAAYEMIVTVYMEGDRRKLTNLLAPK